jgi:subtilisin-like proprotein convertase family protein
MGLAGGNGSGSDPTGQTCAMTMIRRIHRLLVLLVCLLVVPAGAHAQTVTASSGNLAVPLPQSSSIEHTITLDAPAGSVVADVDVFVRATSLFVETKRIQLIAPGMPAVMVHRYEGSAPMTREYDLGSGAADCSGSRVLFDQDVPLPRDRNLPRLLDGLAPAHDGLRDTRHLGMLTGRPAPGEWTLRINTDAIQSTGMLHCWGIVVRLRPALPAQPQRRLLVNGMNRPTGVGPLRAPWLQLTSWHRLGAVFGAGPWQLHQPTCSRVFPGRGMSVLMQVPRNFVRCSSSTLQAMSLRGAGSHTMRGLRVGSPDTLIRELYPRSTRTSSWHVRSLGHLRVPAHDAAWVLHRVPHVGRSPIGMPGWRDSVVALVDDGRVVGFGVAP